MAEYVRMRQEFRADDAAIKKTSSQTLAEMLLRIHTESEYSATIAGFAALSSRVARLMNPHKRSISRWSVSMFIVGFIGMIVGIGILFSETDIVQADHVVSYQEAPAHCNALLKSSFAPEFFSREIRFSSASEERSSAFDSSVLKK